MAGLDRLDLKAFATLRPILDCMVQGTRVYVTGGSGGDEFLFVVANPSLRITQQDGGLPLAAENDAQACHSLGVQRPEPWCSLPRHLGRDAKPSPAIVLTPSRPAASAFAKRVSTASRRRFRSSLMGLATSACLEVWFAASTREQHNGVGAWQRPEACWDMEVRRRGSKETSTAASHSASQRSARRTRCRRTDAVER
jgi:hypothetical protein